MHYSEPYTGGVISVTIGNRQQSVLIESTDDWAMFDTANLGVVNIPVAGEVDIILQGVQFTLINKNGNKQDALPDVCSLTPTKEKETFVPVDVLSEFKAPPLRQENIRGLERQLHRKHELVSHRRRSHRKRKP